MDVVCVDYRTPQLAQRSLGNLTGLPGARRVWVRVDPRGPAEARPGVEVLDLAENRGFGAACNRGAAQGEAELVLFLNADCFPSVTQVEDLVSVLRGRPEVGAVGPALVDPQGDAQRPGGAWLEGAGRLLERVRARRRSRPGLRPVDWVAGTCLLVRRRALEEVGGFCEAFFLYCEDVDLCRRLAERGWGRLVDERVRVTHLGGAAFDAPDERRERYRQGRRTYLRRHASAWRRWAWDAWNRLGAA